MDYEALSDEAYADLNRVVMLVGDYEYITDADIPAARIARARNRAHTPFAFTGFEGLGPPDEVMRYAIPNLSVRPWAPWQDDLRRNHARSDVGGDLTVSSWDAPRPGRSSIWAMGRESPSSAGIPRQIVGADGRIVADTVPNDARGQPGTPYNHYWHRTALAVSAYDSNYALRPGGSAHLVGEHTAITDAHVVYDYGIGYRPRREMAAGVVSKVDTNPVSPNYMLVNYQSVLYGMYSCFVTLVPYGWIYYGTIEWDFAIFDFVDDYNGCSQNPGLWSGYMGVATSGAPDYYTNWPHMTGYDHINEPSGVSTPSDWLPYTAPTGLYRTLAYNGSMRVASWDSRFIEHDLDTNNGASGSGLLSHLLWWYGNGTIYYIGNHIGPYGAANLARRVDWDVLNQLSYTHDY